MLGTVGHAHTHTHTHEFTNKLMPYRLDAALDLEADVTGVYTGEHHYKCFEMSCTLFIICREILQ